MNPDNDKKINSCLYRCKVMHNRLEPKPNRFVYDVFMFYLDIDEIDDLAAKIPVMSRNRWNIFSFRDRDHLLKFKPDVKENIFEYLRSRNILISQPKIMLLTNLSVMGYNFNPVSFYFCFDGDKPVCAVAEVGNTFGDKKFYLLPEETLENGRFKLRTVKYYYVSPFIDMDAEFDFNLGIPGDKLNIQINDYKNGKKFFLASLSGIRKPLTTARLTGYMIRFPLITVKVITLIHWQALKLYLKKIPFYRKTDHPELQREVYNASAKH